jgi:perosamine synthetase
MAMINSGVTTQGATAREALDANTEAMSNLVTELKAAGIETRSFFVSMHRQPALAKFGCDVSGDYPVTDDLARRGLYLPSSSGLTDAQIERISGALLGLRR